MPLNNTTTGSKKHLSSGTKSKTKGMGSRASKDYYTSSAGRHASIMSQTEPLDPSTMQSLNRLYIDGELSVQNNDPDGHIIHHHYHCACTQHNGNALVCTREGEWGYVKTYFDSMNNIFYLIPYVFIELFMWERKWQFVSLVYRYSIN